MKRPLAVILARLPFAFKRPFMIGIAAVLLVGLVGAAVWWQTGVHAAPVTVTVVSAAGDPYSMSGSTGTTVIPVPNAGCTAVDSNGFCTGGVWTMANVWTHATSVPAGAQWIWPTVQWDPTSQGTTPVTFTKQFSIPANALQVQGQIQIAADNSFALQVNGQPVGADQSTATQLPGDSYLLPSTLLHTGTNVITAEVANLPGGDASGNPAGLAFHADISYVLDATTPATTASLAGTLGSNGWYRSPVTVTLTASDPDDTSSTMQTTYSTDGATWQAYSGPVTFSTDGVYNLRFRSVDQATNLEATQTQSFKIDQTSPALNVSGAASQSYDVCATARPVRPTYAPADAMSGLDGSEADSWTTPTSATGAGVYTYTAHAQDNAGNTASETRSYQVQYGTAFRGPRDVFKTDRPYVFEVGSTIPVIFQLVCNGTPISAAVATLTIKPVVLASTPQAGGQSGTQQTEANEHNPFLGNMFRYWKGLNSYYFLLVNTDGTYTNPDGSVVTFAAGTWSFTISLDDGTTHDYTVQLRR